MSTRGTNFRSRSGKIAWHRLQRRVSDMADDDFVKAYRTGGIRAVNDLVREKFGEGPASLWAIERMEESGDWRVHWLYVHGQPDLGAIVKYLGDG
jgi:hypothetical protein